MKTLSPQQDATYNGSLLQLCTIVTITLQDLSQVFLTDLDRDFGKYLSSFGLDCSDITMQLGGGGQTATITVMADKSVTPQAPLGSGGVTYPAIETGLYDMAKVQVAWVDYGASDNVPLVIFTGFITEITYGDATQLQLSLVTPLGVDREICTDSMSQTCRADFGDANCAPPNNAAKIDLQAMVDAPHVYASTGDGQSFVMTRDEVTPPGYYNNGTCQFTSGANKGMGYEIQMISPADANGRETITLKVPMANDVAPGDGFMLWPGCDKVLTSGCTYWNNVINFQGEPFTATLQGDEPTAMTPAQAAGAAKNSTTAINTGLPTAFNWVLQQFATLGFGVTLDLVDGERYLTANDGTSFNDVILSHDVYIQLYNALGGSSKISAADGTLAPADSQMAGQLALHNFKYNANWSQNAVQWTGSTQTNTPAPKNSAAAVFYSNIMINASTYVD